MNARQVLVSQQSHHQDFPLVIYCCQSQVLCDFGPGETSGERRIPHVSIRTGIFVTENSSPFAKERLVASLVLLSRWRHRLLALSQRSSHINQTSELPNKDTGVHSRSPSPSAFNSVLILRHRSSSKNPAQYYTPTSPPHPLTISPSPPLPESKSTTPIHAN